MSKNSPSVSPPAGSTTLGKLGDEVSVPDNVAKPANVGGAPTLPNVPAKVEVTDPNQDPMHPPPGENASSRVVIDEAMPPPASPAEQNAASQAALYNNAGISARPQGGKQINFDANAKIDPSKKYRVTYGALSTPGDGKSFWQPGEILEGVSDTDMQHFLSMGAIEAVDGDVESK